MGRPYGAKNRRTLIRESRIRSAQAAAQLGSGADPYLVANCLDIMEEGMRHFYKLAMAETNKEAKRSHFVDAVMIAEKVAPYRFARLSTVKVGSDKPNPLLVCDGVTAADVKAELLAEMAATGLIPTQIAGLLEAPKQANGGSNGKV
jgi:hypothetical protein